MEAIMRTTKMPDWVRGQTAHPAIYILTVAAVVLALLIVAMSRTVGLAEATGNAAQSTISNDALDVGHAGMRNLPPLPDFPPP
jgi:hypothetical protein